MISLGVTDMARSMKFYGETLGLPLVRETEPGQIAIFRAGETTITLNKPLAQAFKEMAGAVEVVFNVDSVEDFHRLLAARGCVFKAPPHELFSGTWGATFVDPDGHLMTLLGPR
ncbi:MAG TPA: VOC family protein [Bryobacteraceae bacterium]|jgi:predicted enzyme related to lactoylglutathione lyase